MFEWLVNIFKKPVTKRSGKLFGSSGYELSKIEAAAMDELDAKHKQREAQGLPKYDITIQMGYAAYLQKWGYTDEQIQQVIESQLGANNNG